MQQLLVSGDLNGALHLWKASDGQLLCKVETSGGVSILALCCSPDGRCVFTANSDRTLSVFSVEENSLKLVRTLQGHQGAVYRVACSPDSTRLLSGDDKGFLRVWNLRDFECLQELKPHSRTVSLRTPLFGLGEILTLLFFWLFFGTQR
jgi:WD40 repeat protein